MAYKPRELKDIRTAERLFWEQAYACTSANSTQQHSLELPSISLHYATHADVAVDLWRQRFAPWRVGEPVEGEWS